MKFKLSLTSILYFLSLIMMYAQGNIHFFDNEREIEDNRYEGIKGSPYLYEQWKKADITGMNNLFFENLILNYNGESKNFEIRKNNRYIELDEDHYKKIVVHNIDPKDNSSKDVFMKGLHPDLGNKFIAVVYNGNRYKLLRDFDIGISEHKVHNVGKTVEFKRFVPKLLYYLIDSDKLHPLLIKKSAVLSYFDNQQARTFIKQKKLKLNSVEDVVTLLEYLELVSQ